MADRLMRQMVSMFEEELKRQGWSQAIFCRRFQVQPQYLSSCLRGHRQPSLTVLEYWANCLGKTFTVALEDKDAVV